MSLDSIIHRLAKTVYVVLYKTKPSPRHPTGQLTLLIEPGTQKVWSIHNKSVAELHAKENNGMAATWEEAWRLLEKEYGTLSRLEDELMQRAVKAQEATSGGMVLDDKGRPSRAPASDVPGVRDDFNDNINKN